MRRIRISLDKTAICDFARFTLDTAPPFTALSYACGNQSKQYKVYIDGLETPVTTNLFRFLKHIHTIHDKERRDANEYFWIDAICINQTDLAERARQVALFPEIYRKAVEVLVWLGPAYQDSDIATQALTEHPDIPVTKKSLLRFWNHRGGRALVELCSRKYWTRLWTFQELCIGTEVTILCGLRSVPWANFERRLRLLTTNAPKLPEQHMHLLRSVLASPAISRAKNRQEDHNAMPILDVLENTQHLKCSLVEDRVYAILGVKETNIQPAYGRTLPVLLNLVLREQYRFMPLKSLDDLHRQCERICAVFDVSTDEVFRLEGDSGLIPMPTDNDRARMPLTTVYKYDSRVNLWWATFYGHRRVVNFLFESGRINERHLVQACTIGCAAAVDMLIGHRPFDVNGSYEEGGTLLEMASRRGHGDLVRCLLAQDDCDLTVADSGGIVTPGRAVFEDHQEVLQALIDSPKCDVNRKDSHGMPGISLAVRKENLVMVEAFLRSDRCNVNSLDLRGRTPLFLAVDTGKPDIVGKILDCRRCDTNAPDAGGRTPLFLAVETGNPEIVKRLLDCSRCDGNRPDNEGLTPLIMAFTRYKTAQKPLTKISRDPNYGGPVPGSELDIVKLLLVYQTMTGRQDPILQTMSVLTLASAHGCFEIVKEALVEGMPPDQTDTNGNTPLMHLVRRGGSKWNEAVFLTARMLLRYGANPNATYRKGRTLLMLGIILENHDACKLLIDQGADAGARDADGNTALCLAARRGLGFHTEPLLNEMHKRKLNFDATNNDGENAEQIARAHGHEFFIHLRPGALSGKRGTGLPPRREPEVSLNTASFEEAQGARSRIIIPRLTRPRNPFSGFSLPGPVRGNWQRR